MRHRIKWNALVTESDKGRTSVLPEYIIWSAREQKWRTEDGHSNDRQQALRFPSKEAATEVLGDDEQVWRY